MKETVTITGTEWDEFSALVDEIAERSSQLSAAGIAAAVAVNHTAIQGNVDGALGFGVATLETLTRERDAMMERFEASATRISGEPRKPGETPFEYFGRICNIDLLAAMRRNGRVLKIWG